MDKDVKVLNVPDPFWVITLFLLGSFVGSFLNVVIYRLPLEKSVVYPGSHCPQCNKNLAWYDNVPIFAWIYLGGKCRNCKAKYSFRYPAIELLTALLFAGFYIAYFMSDVRLLMPEFLHGGWIIYLVHITLVAALIASTFIDADHWIIPLSVCYITAGVGVIGAMLLHYFIDFPISLHGQQWRMLPFAGPKMAAAGLGSLIGLTLTYMLIKFGLYKRSFHEFEQACLQAQENDQPMPSEDDVNIRREMGREILFLAPIVIMTYLAVKILSGQSDVASKWVILIDEQKWLAGLLGSVFGFMIGAGVVWAIRILGSLAFGREAMGLGDMHLMGAVGAVLGWQSSVVAFFVAPFFGLGYAIMRLVLKGSREIPYGPFLSAATIVVMIFHDSIMDYLGVLFTQPSVVP